MMRLLEDASVAILRHGKLSRSTEFSQIFPFVWRQDIGFNPRFTAGSIEKWSRPMASLDPALGDQANRHQDDPKRGCVMGALGKRPNAEFP